MSVNYSGKINKIRTFALSLIFIGFGVMYLGIIFKDIYWLMSLFMIIGLLFFVFSTIVYFWIGMLSTKAIQIICPSCQKPTKMMGRVDACMHCKQPLTMDESLDGKEFDERYNSKRHKEEEDKQQ